MLEWIAETTLVAAALAIVALLTGRVRSIGPTVRHMLWLVVLIKLLTPPVVSWPWATRSQTLNWPVSLSQARLPRLPGMVKTSLVLNNRSETTAFRADFGDSRCPRC